MLRAGRRRPPVALGRQPGGAARSRRPDAEAGAVTVELALTLPAVVSLLALLAGFGSAAASNLQVHDAARAGARIAALGGSDAEVAAVASQAAGRAVTVSVSRADGLVSVECTALTAIPLLGSRELAARAVAACEPGRGCGVP
ncbi:MAG: pilus assembly protein [Bifidobacteriaceae bacterium]|jgi:Flp pilus assembly protein TadG|nr:pilus assembly protein [Bifidobacteriaceae bacterium]